VTAPIVNVSAGQIILCPEVPMMDGFCCGDVLLLLRAHTS
jgi:hypothetical protein